MKKQYKAYFLYLWELVLQTAKDTGIFVGMFKDSLMINFLILVIYLAVSYAVSLQLLINPTIDEFLTPLLGNWSEFVLLVIVLPFSFFFFRIIFWTPFKLYYEQKKMAELPTWKDVDFSEIYFPQNGLLGIAAGIRFKSNKRDKDFIDSLSAVISHINRAGIEPVFRDLLPVKSAWVIGDIGFPNIGWEGGVLSRAEDRFLCLAKVEGGKALILAQDKNDQDVSIPLENDVHYQVNIEPHGFIESINCDLFNAAIFCDIIYIEKENKIIIKIVKTKKK